MAPAGLPGGVALAVADERCAFCGGLGRVGRKYRGERTCDCVWRAAFRACLKRFQRIQAQQHETVYPRSSLERFEFRDRDHKSERHAFAWGRLNEEYCADFWLVAKRHLSQVEFRILRLHFLLGADWKFCCRKLGMDRRNFFHSTRRVEHRLGRIFAELRPYALFPVDHYFSGLRSGRPPVRMLAELGLPSRPPAQRLKPRLRAAAA